MAKSNEPLWWLPFFAGAGISALLMPVTILVILIAGFRGMYGKELWEVLNHFLVRFIVFVLISLSMFHAVHRIRYLLVDLGLKEARGPISVVCYGSAIVGSVLTALLALKLF
jgi:fumarate reductase subunit D